MAESLYKLVRLRRRRRRPDRQTPCSVEQLANGRWVSLGTFGTVDDAVDFMVDRVEIMKIVEQMEEEGQYD